jgi:hypothetical protein
MRIVRDSGKILRVETGITERRKSTPRSRDNENLATRFELKSTTGD